MYDLVIIGGGAGGMMAAEYAAKLGASVALVDKADRLGGECLNNGCVPSKALIHAAKTFYRASNSAKFGIEAYPELNFEKMMQSVQHAQSRIHELRHNDSYFQQMGIDVIHEHARFISTDKLRVGNAEIKAKKFIIATGSRPRVPAIPGLIKSHFLTNESIFELKKLPRRLAVIGGGVIGCEIASAFNQIGSEVTVFERYDHLSLRVDKPIAEFVAKRFSQRKMQVHTNSEITSIKKTQRGTRLEFTAGKDSLHQYVDTIFVSTGRVANLDLGLDNAGVKYTDSAITIDKYGRTSNKNVWAIGDVTGTAGFTHVATEQALYAVLHALFGLGRQVKLKILPYVIYTSPEVAHVGKTAKQLESENIKHTVRSMNYDQIDRAVIEDKEGLIQICINSKQQLLGSTMVGSHATEQIGQYVMAMNFNLNMRDFAKVLQPYPTYAMATKQAAIDLLLENALKSELAGHAMKAAKILRR